jgi:hypothetical protein
MPHTKIPPEITHEALTKMLIARKLRAIKTLTVETRFDGYASIRTELSNHQNTGRRRDSVNLNFFVSVEGKA